MVEGGPSSTKSWIGNLFHRNPGNEASSQPAPHGFEILEEKIVYSGWRTIVQRKVRMRNGKIVDFDVSTAVKAMDKHYDCQ